MENDIDILEHELVPKHEVLSTEEKVELCKRLKIEPWQLPWISSDDPAVRAIGAKPGDVIRIHRKSPTAGTSIAYRFVVVRSLRAER